MANSDKNISIIPNKSLTGQPQIIFTGQGNDPITLKVLDSTIGSLSFEGSAGQLLSITDSLSSGSIFSVNDISGMPSIDVNADGTIALAPFSGNIAIGVTSASFKLHVNGTLYTASAATFNSNVILSNGNLQTTTSTFNLITNTASTINIGTTSGSTISIASTAGTTTVNNSAIITGNLTVNGGTITSTATTFNLLNTTITNANVLGASDTIILGSAGGSTTIRNAATRVNGTLTVTGVSVHQGAGAFNSTLSVTGTSTLIGDVTASGDIAVNGGDITSTATTFNLLNATVTGLNVGGAANTVLLGGTGGTTTIRNAGTNINGTLTVTGVSVHQGAGAFNSTLTVTGVTTLQGASTLQSAVNMNSTLTVTGVSVHQGAGSFNSTLSVTGTSTLIGDVTASGDIAVNGGDITSTATTFNLLNATVTNANVLGAANTVLLGGTGGTATIRNAGTNINGTLTVTGVSVHQGAGSFNSTLSVTGVSTFQSAILANGGTITSSSTTFNLLNTTVTGLNLGGAANTVVIGGTGGTTTIRNAGTNINGTLTVTGATVVQGALSTNSTLSVTSNAIFVGSILANGGTVTSTATTFNLLNTTVTNANVLGAATRVVIGANSSGYALIRNSTILLGGTVTGTTIINTTTGTVAHLVISPQGNLYLAPSLATLGLGSVTELVVTNGQNATGQVQITGGDLYLGTKFVDELDPSPVNIIFEGRTDNANDTTLTVVDPTASRTISLPDASGVVAITTNGSLSVTGEATFAGSVIANGGTITSSATTFNLLNTTVTNANVLGAANTVVIGGTGGSTTIRNASTNINGTLTVSGNATFLGSALYTDTILAIGNQINIANAAGGRIAFGDYDGAGNSTYVFIRDATSSLLISNPYGDVGIGDPNNVDSGYALLYNAAAGYLDGGNSTLTNFGTGSFNGLLTASAGISVSGATAAIFNGTVSCNSNTIYKPTLQYYNEVLASPTISANVLTLDLSTAQMFTVSLNANITTFTISNTPATANRSIGFTLIFTADGTARTVTWGAAVKWANNDPPTLTSTNGKKDILSFVSPDGGTNWYGFIGGLNF